jgi:hypothetical protein
LLIGQGAEALDPLLPLHAAHVPLLALHAGVVPVQSVVFVVLHCPHAPLAWQAGADALGQAPLAPLPLSPLHAMHASGPPPVQCACA